MPHTTGAVRGVVWLGRAAVTDSRVAVSMRRDFGVCILECCGRGLSSVLELLVDISRTKLWKKIARFVLCNALKLSILVFSGLINSRREDVESNYNDGVHILLIVLVLKKNSYWFDE